MNSRDQATLLRMEIIIASQKMENKELGERIRKKFEGMVEAEEFGEASREDRFDADLAELTYVSAAKVFGKLR